jgi:hypothetical protein
MRNRRVFKNLIDRRAEFHQLADLRTQIPAEPDSFLGVLPFRAESHSEHTARMHAIRRDDVDL